MANKKVVLVRLCKTAKGWRRYPVAVGKNGRIKPNFVIVDGQEREFKEGRYQLRTYEGTRMVYKDAGENAAAAQTARTKTEHLLEAKASAKEAGVKIECNVVIGRTYTLPELRQNFDAIFIANGAGLPVFMNVPGENMKGVYSANEYLTRINLMGAGKQGFDTPVLKGKNIAIIGGGNTAMDAVRIAKRQGASRAMIVYRRSLADMPARLEEIRHAQEEGIEFICQTNPVEYKGDDKGKLIEMTVQKMELGAPDDSGRRGFIPIKGSEYIIPVDLAIVSIGVSPNPIIKQSIEGLSFTKWETIVVNDDTMQTSIPFIFAGGDIVRGGATVILAMGDGKKAAKAMDEYLQKK